MMSSIRAGCCIADYAYYYFDDVAFTPHDEQQPPRHATILRNSYRRRFYFAAAPFAALSVSLLTGKSMSRFYECV